MEEEMAKIVGCMAMSHGPQLLTPSDKWPELPARAKGPFNPKPGIAGEITLDAMRAHQDRCNDAIAKLRDQLQAWKPDTIVIIGDDQHENLLDDNIPPFTLFIGDEVDATRKYRYFGTDIASQAIHYTSNGALAREMLEGLMEQGFDPAWSRKTRMEGGLGHAFGRVLEFVLPKADVPIVAVMVNTYYPPAPTAARCVEFGKVIGAVARRSANAKRVVFIGSGGLSHTRIDEKLDADFIAALESNDLDFMASLPNDILVAGTSEIRNWMIAAAAAGAGGRMVDYVPCYRNPDGVGCAMGFAYWEKTAA
jgi:aromatic ring-opening dioxygenase catalytic subunit (LigB family)